MSKIHYAVTIELINNNQDNSNIGMSAGTIRYVSDNLDMSSGYVYEDNSSVTDIFYSDVVSKANGFSKMGSKLDITSGGDYGFLQAFNLTLANITAEGIPYHKALDDEQTYVIGGKVKVYVIIDSMLYSRWSGNVTGVTFNDKTFTWNCEDSHSSKNNTITNEAFGMIKRLKLVVDTDSNSNIEPLHSTPITRVRPDEPMESLYTLIPGMEYIRYDSMSSKINASSTGVHYQAIAVKSEQYTHVNNMNYAWYNKAIQTDSEYFQIWFQKNNDIDMDNVVYVGVAKDSDTPSTKYTVLTHDDIIDQHGNSMTRVLVEGVMPITSLENQFGNYEDLRTAHPEYYEGLDTFDGTLIKLYTTGVKIVDGVNADNITDIVDKDDNSLSLSTLTKINGEYYLPFNVTTFKKYTIPNNKISYKYTTTGGFADITQNSFDKEFTGTIEPPYSSPNTSMLLDIRDNILNMKNYDNVFLGLEAQKIEYQRDFRGYFRALSDIFVFDSWEYNYSPHTADIQTGGTLTPLYLTNNTEEIFISSVADKLDIAIGSIYNDAKYGLVRNGATTPIDMAIPMGQQMQAITYTEPDGPVIEVVQTGGTNLHINTYTNNFPLICANKGVLASWYAETNTVGAGATTGQISNSVYVREFGIGNSFILSSDETKPNLKDNISNEEYVIIDVSGSVSNNLVYEQRDTHTEDVHTRTLAPTSNIAIPSHLAFSIIGENNNSASDIFAKYEDSDSSTGTDTIGKVLAKLTGSTEVADIRPTYFVGNYIKEQINKFNVITSLCQQSFIAGYTNRQGDIVFKKLLEYDNTTAVEHTNTNIVENSLKNFKHTPISKVYNDFEVKYNYIDNKPNSTLEIHNVDKEEFPLDPNVIGGNIYKPAEGEVDPNHYTWEDNPFGGSEPIPTEVLLVFQDSVYEEAGYDFQINDHATLEMLPTDDAQQDGMRGSYEGRVTLVSSYTGGANLGPATAVYFTVVSASLILENPSSLVYPRDVEPATNTTYTSVSFDTESSKTPEWKKWVVGVNDYNAGKKLWLKAKEGYLRTGVVQKAPANRTDLKWAVERNWFYDVETYDSTGEYAYDYFEKLIDWTVYQKFTIDYSIPITPDNLKLELMQDVKFADPIITPGSVGKGWITKYEVDPKKDLINLQITFEPNDLNPDEATPGRGFYPFTMLTASDDCGNIIERQGNTDIIIEAATNTDNIIESKC